jgi:hypothetical protein
MSLEEKILKGEKKRGEGNVKEKGKRKEKRKRKEKEKGRCKRIKNKYKIGKN